MSKFSIQDLDLYYGEFQALKISTWIFQVIKSLPSLAHLVVVSQHS